MDQDEALANEAEQYRRKFRLHKRFQNAGFILHITPEYVDPNAETVVIKRKKRHNK